MLCHDMPRLTTFLLSMPFRFPIGLSMLFLVLRTRQSVSHSGTLRCVHANSLINANYYRLCMWGGGGGCNGFTTKNLFATGLPPPDEHSHGGNLLCVRPAIHIANIIANQTGLKTLRGRQHLTRKNKTNFRWILTGNPQWRVGKTNTHNLFFENEEKNVSTDSEILRNIKEAMYKSR